MPIDELGLVERIRAECNGHPHAKIAWPHRILHEAADALAAKDAAIERLVAERDALKIESSKHAHDADKAREDRDNAERRSETFWSRQAKAAEAQRNKLKEALDQLSSDAKQIMSKHDPRGAETAMSGDEANKRVHQFVADAATFIESIPSRARQALQDSKS